MKHIITSLLCLGLGLATTAQAAEVGFGYSLGGTTNSIRVPVRLNNGLTLEGYAGISDSRAEAGENFLSSKDYQVGASVYWRRSLTPSTECYYGPRLLYMTSKESTPTQSIKSHGYQVAPVLGLEYFPIKQMSIGGEVGLGYTRMDNDYSSTLSDGTSSSSSRYFGTFSAAFIKVYF